MSLCSPAATSRMTCSDGALQIRVKAKQIRVLNQHLDEQEPKTILLSYVSPSLTATPASRVEADWLSQLRGLSLSRG